MNIWASLRITFWIFLLLIGIDSNDRIPIDECDCTLRFYIILFVFFFFWPIIICLFEGLLYSIANRQKKWKRPGLKVNPFRDKKPLQFWWTIIIGLIFLSIGNIIFDLMDTVELNKWAYGYLAAGIGGIAGIKTSLYLFCSRFEPPNQIYKLATEQSASQGFGPKSGPYP